MSTTNREMDAMLDLKFVLNTQDIHYHNLKKGCLINQNKGEGSLTCKTGLYESLQNGHQFMANWYPMEHCDEMGAGVQSFYPRSHLTNNGESFYFFIKDFVITHAEGYIKSFLKQVTATDDNTILMQVKKRNLLKEKLLICCFVTKRRLKLPCDKLDSKVGITFDRIN
jgi:hypothetical protein